LKFRIEIQENKMRSLKELMDLHGRVALITGGAGHIGSSMGEALAELGAKTIVLDSTQEACDSISKLIQQKYNVDSFPLAVDLSTEKEVRGMVDTVLARFGRLDILINCAAIVNTSNMVGWIAPFVNQSSELWRLTLEINLTSPFILTQVFSEALAASGNGTIINVASIYGMVGPDMRMYEDTQLGNAAAYGASKGGLLQLTRWLATVLAPKIRVNSITPGGVWRNQPEIFVERYAERTPLKRMGIEEDFKGAIAYLASDLSAYVTGQNLIVDGGWTTW
jgi:NAD(P)-dependent dehydrogenase (short-subunit alcohol dehydrogenase family)